MRAATESSCPSFPRAVSDAGGPTRFCCNSGRYKGAAQIWGSCCAPRVHRCCPNPHPEVGGACAAQLWSQHWACGWQLQSQRQCLCQRGLQQGWQQRLARCWHGCPRGKLWAVSPHELPVWCCPWLLAWSRGWAWTGAGTACFLPWMELSKEPVCAAAHQRSQPQSVCGSRLHRKFPRWGGAAETRAGRLVAPVTKAVSGQGLGRWEEAPTRARGSRG